MLGTGSSYGQPGARAEEAGNQDEEVDPTKPMRDTAPLEVIAEAQVDGNRPQTVYIGTVAKGRGSRCPCWYRMVPLLA